MFHKGLALRLQSLRVGDMTIPSTMLMERGTRLPFGLPRQDQGHLPVEATGGTARAVAGDKTPRGFEDGLVSKGKSRAVLSK